MIGQQLRRARRAQGLTLRDLSERTGIAVSNLSRLECGRTDPRASTLTTVCEALGMTLQVTPVATVTIDDVRQRMAEGAARLRSIGVTARGVEARLRWKEARGLDTSVERRMLGA